MKIPFNYIKRNFFSRKLTASITIAGVALVIFVFTVVLMMVFGLSKTLASTGSKQNAIVVRKSSQGEISSIIGRETANIISTLGQIAKSPDGKPLISAEPVIIFNQTKKEGGMSNVTVRGVTPVAFQIRDNIKLISGKMFSFGARELVVGNAIVKRFNGVALGDKIKLAGDMWTIVGIFDAQGTGFDSEVWGDSEQLLSAFQRSTYSSITFRLSDPSQISSLKTVFESDTRLKQFEPEIESVYFGKQSEDTSNFIGGLGIFITIIFSVGAIIGATITMYAAVANRSAEIGTLRAIGFGKGSILFAFLLESVLLSLIGGIIGLFLASFLSLVEISMLNFQSFAELAFSFSLDIIVIAISLGFALLMGIVGGFLPARRAANMTIIDALRGA